MESSLPSNLEMEKGYLEVSLYVENSIYKNEDIKLIMECSVSVFSDYQWFKSKYIHSRIFYN